jgi:alcohol dehydrogenase, propanol-preferring
LTCERDVRSVTANTRQDGQEFLDAATAIPVRPRAVPFWLDQANQALIDLKPDRLSGTAALTME